MHEEAHAEALTAAEDHQIEITARYLDGEASHEDVKAADAARRLVVADSRCIP